MSRPLGIAALISVLLHLLVTAALYVASERSPPSDPEAPDQPTQVELLTVEQAGTGETTAAAAQPNATAEARVSEESPPPDEAALPIAPPPQAPPAPPSQQPAESTQLTFNLGGTESQSNAIVVGDQILPARADDRARNRPPLYPLEAARRRQQGTVIVIIHVSPEGLAAGADIAQSSGYPLLDQAAREAVLTWRFVPAVRGGIPIPFDMPMRFVFEGG